ncbi:MAG: hypothetical protein WC932_04965 [archaeon]|jgi:hypothetical protein
MSQTISQKMRNNSRLESDRNPKDIPVFIDYINVDQSIATVRIVGSDENKSLELPVIMVDPDYIRGPINVSNYNGVLEGDPKAPTGVRLIKKATVEPNIRHGVSQALYGSASGRAQEPVDRVVGRTAKNATQKQNHENLPNGQMIVIKPPRQLPVHYKGRNPFVNDSPADLLDAAGAHILVSEDEARLIADPGNGIVVNSRSGINMAGKVNIGTSIQDVRIGGAWRFNPMLQFQVPSTAVTPIPTLLYDYPGKDILGGVDKYIDAMNS